MKKLNIFTLIACLFFFACAENDKPKEENSKPVVDAKPHVVAPAFNADSAFVFIEKQLSFGPRTPNSQAHNQCANFMTQKLKSYGGEVKLQDFEVTAHDGKVLKGQNIFAAFNPKATKRIILAAHWDTRPWADNDTKDKDKPIMGANDGASGVAVILEIARVLSTSKTQPNVGVDVIFFDLEDYGVSDKADSYCYGSQYWAKNKENYRAFYGILLDMVGGKNALFAKEGKSMEFAPSVVDKVWASAQKAGHGQYFLMQQVGGIIDDHVYVSELGGFPMIDIINYSHKPDDRFGDFWHTHADNLEVIDKNTLKAVGETVLDVLYNE